MEIKFNECIEDKEGYILEFSFQGKTSKKENIDKIKKLLDNFKNENILKKDMLRNVVVLKTIFKDCYNEMLVVLVKKDNIKEEVVEYVKDNLASYEYKDSDIKVNYRTYVHGENEDKLDVSFKNNSNDMLLGKYPYTGIIKNKFNEVINLIDSLGEARPLVLGNDEKILIQVYKLFYDRNPDFTKESINREIQTMAVILILFGIDLGDYSFQVLQSGKRPTSLVLERIIDNLYPLGEVGDVIEPVALDRVVCKKIKVIGKEIRDQFLIRDEYSLMSLLSKLIYAGRYNLVNMDESKIEALSDSVYCTLKEVKDCLKLVRKIDEKLK